jgi:uncharacterized protein
VPDLTIFIIASLIFFCGAYLQSIVGFGYNILTVPGLTILTNSQNAVAVVSIPSWICCIFLVWKTGREAGKVELNFSPVLPLLAMCAVGTLAGATLLKWIDTHIMLTALGILLLLFVITDRLRKNWRPNPEHATRLALGVGAVTGILNGLAGVSGPTLAPYLYSLKLQKEQFIYYLNVLFLFLGFFQFVSFGILGFYSWERILFAFALVPVSLAGLFLGAAMRSRVSQQFFNRLVLLVLFVTALDLLRRGLF